MRLLLDDNNTRGLDNLLAALNAHPNIQVRLFNPFRLRRRRILEFLADFARLNRRMHNKSFTADNQATIIGGRNIGDEYFDAGQVVSFADLDVLAIGPVVSDVAWDFDRYWVSPSSCPADCVLPPADAASMADVEAGTSQSERNPAAREYIQALANSPFVCRLLAGQLPFEWAVTRMVSDDPRKGFSFPLERRLAFLTKGAWWAKEPRQKHGKVVKPLQRFVRQRNGATIVLAKGRENGGVGVLLLLNSCNTPTSCLYED